MSDKVTRIGPTGRVTIPLKDRAGIEWVEIHRREDNVIELRPVDPLTVQAKNLLSRLFSKATPPPTPVAIAKRVES